MNPQIGEIVAEIQSYINTGNQSDLFSKAMQWESALDIALLSDVGKPVFNDLERENLKIICHEMKECLQSFYPPRFSQLWKWQQIIKAATADKLEALGGCDARPLDEYHEDMGFVVWWKFPVNEPSWIGMPNDSDWPGYHTHFTSHPPIPAQPKESCDAKNP